MTEPLMHMPLSQHGWTKEQRCDLQSGGDKSGVFLQHVDLMGARVIFLGVGNPLTTPELVAGRVFSVWGFSCAFPLSLTTSSRTMHVSQLCNLQGCRAHTGNNHVGINDVLTALAVED
jgi:hypothetical protein